MKIKILLAVLLLIPAGGLWAATQAIFTSVTGKVEIRGHKGHMLRIAEKDATVVEGERLVTGANAQANLQIFDGSEIKISPSSDVWLDQLQKPDTNNKIIKFKLAAGQIWAKVTHLLSSKSSFEINAGGVVCGVRGTEYSVAYDPATGKVDVAVVGGTIWTTSSGGVIKVFNAGDKGTFSNGQWDFHPGSQPQPPQQPPSTGAPHTGFIASNPFYGFNGTGIDDFNNHLTDLTGGVPGVVGQTGNNGLSDHTGGSTGLYPTLNLQLSFPQFSH